MPTCVGVSEVGSALLSGKITTTDIIDGFRSHPGRFSTLPGRRTTRVQRSTRRTTMMSQDLWSGSSSGGARNTSRITISGLITTTFGDAAEGEGPIAEGDRSSRKTKKRVDHDIPPTPTEIMDDVLENLVHSTIEQPFCLDACLQYPAFQRACFPAEYATRHRRQTNEGHGDTVGADMRMDESAKFGLPDFATSGFEKVSPSEMELKDTSVLTILGLQMALHRKTSVQRYCLQVDKASLAPGVGAAEVKTLVRHLQRCDHVNILNCIEAFEDAESLHFLYEYFPCCTLVYFLERQDWNQEKLANISRECIAAVAFASSLGLQHLGWTFNHVLIPDSAVETGDPTVSKVFGFGLMGILYTDTCDRLCWAPEMLERHSQAQKDNSNFVMRMEAAVRSTCDSWGIGIVIYTLISKKPPFLNEEQILAKKWRFNHSVDAMDPEVKSLVESFLSAVPEKRLTAERALQHEWIRRRWRPPGNAETVFSKLAVFAASPLPKRLFGRFLTRFLDAGHMRYIAKDFYALDTQGTGVLSLKELVHIAKIMGQPSSIAAKIAELLKTPGTQSISLPCFAEAFAEEVIDGRALRHAFESLDDDGSEEVSPAELFDALQNLGENLTFDEVVKYIEDTEAAVGSASDETKMDSTQDHQIDYEEFCLLFPVRVKKIQVVADRIQTERSTSEQITGQFASQRDDVAHWLHGLKTVIETTRRHADKTLERSEAGAEAAKALKKDFSKLQEFLTHVPGPVDAKEHLMNSAKHRKESAKRELRANKPAVNVQVVEHLLGFDSWLQDLAVIDNWANVITSDNKTLKLALNVSNKLSGNVDQFRAHDSAESVLAKMDDLLSKVQGQFDEYTAFADCASSPEVAVCTGSSGAPVLSGRGLRAREGEAEDDGEGTADDENKGTENAFSRFVQDVTSRFR